jgi:hypothetical protein
MQFCIIKIKYMRDSAIFYRSFYEAIKDLPAENQAEVYNAIFEYSLNCKEVELTGISKTIFTLIKPQIQANIKRFKNGSKAKQKQSGSKTEARIKQTRSKTEANNNDNNNVNDNNNLNKNENVNENNNLPAGEVIPHPLQLIVKNLREVSRIKTQLTPENCEALLRDHGEEMVKEILLAMENTKGITNKYTSVYLTVNAWALRRKADIRITDPGATHIKRPFKPITPDQL